MTKLLTPSLLNVNNGDPAEKQAMEGGLRDDDAWQKNYLKQGSEALREINFRIK